MPVEEKEEEKEEEEEEKEEKEEEMEERKEEKKKTYPEPVSLITNPTWSDRNANSGPAVEGERLSAHAARPPSLQLIG